MPIPILRVIPPQGIYQFSGDAQFSGLYQDSGIYFKPNEDNTVSGQTIIQNSVIIGPNQSGFSFSGFQMLPSVDNPGSCTMWISGSTVRTMNNSNGQIVYSGNNPNSGVFAAVYELGSVDTGTALKGGVIYAKKGIYVFSGKLPFDASGDTRIPSRGIQIKGEGMSSTKFLFRGSGIGIHVKDIDHFELHDLWLNTDKSGIHQLLYIEGSAFRGTLDGVRFEGIGVSGIVPMDPNNIRSGQLGFFMDGDIPTQPPYQWTIERSHFINLDIGGVLHGLQNNNQAANQHMMSNLFFRNCKISMEIQSVQSVMNNFTIQGDRSGNGSYGIRFLSGGSLNNVGTINAEFYRSGSAVVVYEQGAAQNTVFGLNSTTLDPSASKFVVLDYAARNASGVAWPGNNRNNTNPGIIVANPFTFAGADWDSVTQLGAPAPQNDGGSGFIYLNNLGSPVQLAIQSGHVSGLKLIRHPNLSGTTMGLNIISGLVPGMVELRASDGIEIQYASGFPPTIRAFPQ